MTKFLKSGICVCPMEIQSTGSLVITSLRTFTIEHMLSLYFRFILKYNTIAQEIAEIPHLKCITINIKPLIFSPRLFIFWIDLNMLKIDNICSLCSLRSVFTLFISIAEI